MTIYSRNQWQDNNVGSPYGPISAARLGTMEAGIDAANIVYNVKADAYGAKGDGTTNDATAIQAAITAAQSAGGGTVFFPVGVYLCASGLTVTAPNVNLVGVGWNQTTTTGGSVIKASTGMTDLINVSSLGESFRMTGIALDGNGNATNCLTVDALNCQILQSYARRPATNGVGFNATSNSTSIWFTDCRFNGANQAGTIGWQINGTDSTMKGCKGVNCLDAVQYLGGASGGIMVGCHHTPGSSIGRCCIYLNGNAARIQLVGNRIDNHALGSGIQISPTANTRAIQINGNTFYQNVMTNGAFAAIGVDTTSANVYGLTIKGNTCDGASAHLYSAFLSAQKLDGTAASNPTRISSQGTVSSGNTAYAVAMYGTSSSPLVGASANALSTDGTTWASA